MSYKLNINQEFIDVLKKIGSMCKSIYIYQHKVDGEYVVDMLYRPSGDSGDKTINYRAKVYTHIVDDVDEFEFEIVNLKFLISEIKDLKSIPTFEIDDRKSRLTVKHDVGKYETALTKRPPSLKKFEQFRDNVIAKIKKYALQFKINEKEFTHLKKRLAGVEGINDGYIQWNFDIDDTFDIDFKVENEEGEITQEVKPCYKLLVKGESNSTSNNSVEHHFWVPVDDIDYDIESFSIKTTPSDLNKVRVSNGSDIDVEVSYKNQKLDHINKIGFTERGDNSEVSVFNMRKQEK